MHKCRAKVSINFVKFHSRVLPVNVRYCPRYKVATGRILKVIVVRVPWPVLDPDTILDWLRKPATNNGAAFMAPFVMTMGAVTVPVRDNDTSGENCAGLGLVRLNSRRYRVPAGRLALGRITKFNVPVD